MPASIATHVGSRLMVTLPADTMNFPLAAAAEAAGAAEPAGLAEAGADAAGTLDGGALAPPHPASARPSPTEPSHRSLIEVISRNLVRSCRQAYAYGGMMSTPSSERP